ncbi:MAG: ASPIC/UnbV domain-containing protein, partial [Planctomycetota bacterium]
ALLRNSLPSGRWIGFRLRGVRSNRDAYGTRVTVEAGGRRQVKETHADGSIFSSSDARLVFGLGSSESVEAAGVRWPSGREEAVRGLPAGRYHLWVEGVGLVTSGAGR